MTDLESAESAFKKMISKLRKMRLIIKVRAHETLHKGFAFNYPKDGDSVQDIKNAVQEKTKEDPDGIKIMQEGDEVSETSQLDSLGLRDGSVFIVALASLKGQKLPKKSKTPRARAPSPELPAMESRGSDNDPPAAPRRRR